VDAERGASGQNNAALQSHHQDCWPAHLLVEVEIAAAEDSEASAVDMIACVVGRCSEG